ncbi:hypothetical protein COCSUDRAFT_44377 [Coccomyxa subellipsoidea C-169]|uniref:Uncharacterized protein n=1 Tax=Coccomyxa subellipsoidea (strain C-169) TaxID=574566 RepID=I0YNM1_COCSC|nr:hypothetical protein COCSUDRAFT_44377 [Coccomyxa subellipsoidea C-169]EIE19990.1 hypothetical protein COCSUDRAFT_44377 [Coccomyxa subellipsoidea C-169]|eukprot:XP_005644534.1 hypothetical protein COCSUDRAFT_44377 [Coccomyxa subellipsoidea C-169]
MGAVLATVFSACDVCHQEEVAAREAAVRKAEAKCAAAEQSLKEERSKEGSFYQYQQEIKHLRAEVRTKEQALEDYSRQLEAERAQLEELETSLLMQGTPLNLVREQLLLITHRAMAIRSSPSRKAATFLYLPPTPQHPRITPRPTAQARHVLSEIWGPWQADVVAFVEVQSLGKEASKEFVPGIVEVSAQGVYDANPELVEIYAFHVPSESIGSACGPPWEDQAGAEHRCAFVRWLRTAEGAQLPMQRLQWATTTAVSGATIPWYDVIDICTIERFVLLQPNPTKAGFFYYNKYVGR